MSSEADDIPVNELKKLEVTDDDEVTPGYTAPAKVDLKTIQALDADDESLQKYKADLLKGSENVVDEGGPNVVVKSLSVCFKDREDIKLDLTGDLNDVKKHTVRIKEGSTYHLLIAFRVQREIVSGLRLFNATFRKGIRVDSSNFMVGSYGPKTEEQTFKTSSDEAPAGMMSRGHYTVHSKFVDDDKNAFLKWEWSFDITKDW